MNQQNLFDLSRKDTSPERPADGKGTPDGSVSKAAEAGLSPARPPAAADDAPSAGMSRQDARRAAIRWLESTHPPDGLMVSVPTRRLKYKADIAAFWSVSAYNSNGQGPGRLMTPRATMIIECYTGRDECWGDCVAAAGILPRLEEKRRRRDQLEAVIRESEPDLRRSDELFEEMASWDYDRARNPEYRRLLAEIATLEEALHKGTKFEQIGRAAVADSLYAAVPAGLLTADELANGWGLLWIHEDMRVTVEKEPAHEAIPVANRMHLIQNIAAAAKPWLLAMEGIRHDPGDAVYFVKKPRLHRKRRELHPE